MKKTQLIGLLFLLTSFSVFGQSLEWETLTDSEYSIEYPNNWEVNKSSQFGASFILLSSLSSEKDQFRENVNLIIQDLTAHDIDLNQYVDISENQVKKMITNATIISSDRIKKGGIEFHKIIYTGDQGVFNLKFEQYYWIQNKKAFVLTLTCEQTEFDNSKEIGEKILNSFTIN